MGQLRGPFFAYPDLGRFLREVDLNQALDNPTRCCCPFVKFPGQGYAIHRMDEVEKPHRVCSLVALEVSDKMPLYTAFPYLLNLCPRLLDIIFPEDHHARCHGLPYAWDGCGLGDRNELYPLWVPADLGCCMFYPFPYPTEVFLYFTHG